MSGKFQRTYSSHREARPSSASSHERYYMPHPTPPVHTCTYRQPKTSMSFLRKFTLNVITCHTPPHPTNVYKQQHSLLKAVVQLTIYLSIYINKYIYIYILYMHVCHGCGRIITYHQISISISINRYGMWLPNLKHSAAFELRFPIWAFQRNPKLVHGMGVTATGI